MVIIRTGYIGIHKLFVLPEPFVFGISLIMVNWIVLVTDTRGFSVRSGLVFKFGLAELLTANS